MKKISAFIFSLSAALLSIVGCSSLGIPDGVQPVSPFKLELYLGKWYEIARLDHSFEKGMSHVTAKYSMRNDGGVKVINRGFLADEQRWKEAEGKAFFVGDTNTGHLKVSFFGPFYGSYVIFELDQEGYEYAYVTGSDKSYLWLLSRTPNVSQSAMDSFIAKTKSRGYKTDEIIFVDHGEEKLPFSSNPKQTK